MTRDWRDVRIEELERAVADRDRSILELRALVSLQAVQIAALTANVKARGAPQPVVAELVMAAVVGWSRGSKGQGAEEGEWPSSRRAARS